jgi:transposase
LDAVAAEQAMAGRTAVPSFTRKKSVRAPLPAHLPRERVVVAAPSACPCCGGKLVKMGENITETLEVVPRQWKVIQTVREKFTCRTCEKIAQPPAPFHVIARARPGARLLAMILYGKFGEHQPLNRQSVSFAKEGILARQRPFYPGFLFRSKDLIPMKRSGRQSANYKAVSLSLMATVASRC